MNSNFRMVAHILLLQDMTNSEIKRGASVLVDWTANELRDEIYRLLGLLVIQQRMATGTKPTPETMDIDLALHAIVGQSQLDW